MHNEASNSIMEWNRILLCHDKVFLCECKYKITKVKDSEFKQLSDKELVKVACNSLFSEALKQKSVKLRLVVIYLDSSHYYVEIPKK
ncbi:hypothetical protein RhiirC2_797866 [Rhizophagus irregularis]|uniref:Uncharacterized protein n=1 Tax=Rhizophagus irregularis TaxID=588596 RepID=A0A2N1M7A3_9GLOM|nr:hypothetical protein RhiirC2_797866 [Rhizophagus irregularis]